MRNTSILRDPNLKTALLLLFGIGLSLLIGVYGIRVGYAFSLLVLLGIAGTAMLLVKPELGIIAFPLVSLFTAFDPLGIGFSPEKLLTLALLFLWFAQRVLGKPGNEPAFPLKLALPFVLFWTINATGLFRIESLFNGLLALQSLAGKGILVFLIYSMISTVKDLKLCLYSLGVLTFLSFTWMFLMILHYGDLTLFRDNLQMLFAQNPVLEYTVFFNPNTASLYGAMLFPLMFLAGVAESNRRKSWFFFVCGGMAGLGTMLTFSRAGLLALLLAAGYLTWTMRGKLVGLGPVGLVAGGILWLLASTPFLLEVVRGAVFLEEVGVRRRIGIVQAALSSFGEHPILGSGPETFRQQMAERYYMVERLSQGEQGISAHNDLLNITVETGILGLLAFSSFVVVYIKCLWDLFKKVQDPYLRLILVGTVGGLLAAALHSQFHEVLIHNLFWYILALPLVIGKLHTMRWKQSPTDDRES